ncbi:hypothetical protein COW36_01580 [bacterium (Candidatus Blackallbacteria) CG17_big_fil_post_rev_8_21_14_2_50_48_46]|uniref:Uncharacterized protein n=1 Tax=bacterium (Candidatus Blackallbacteria) CG17_big_fil_post_rev_8_21_14_2_50_48_46 TaxID=2014261 RepID=A0A2M7GBK4_9BACT|nr:MAG: hypothetical protein COW64_09595 [bacterium (Candidatus Blackallbacteria) CG18_big_fil_WC_8_21_14_2_50_49_26]PIW19556.1 MAG: hypothetical protein COW36_01580 [bacterium (Candidatus Blackallbacteria) CG17_big_fil_post_rev_8_21_14_2_50_48_46]PIW48841.1 MAG: hypothetical protein COW20_06875 [bacterium (Candidatus Blackallbacteria) CG13_big_fil_rev_8_21_14_2_50_49_14]
MILPLILSLSACSAVLPAPFHAGQNAVLTPSSELSPAVFFQSALLKRPLYLAEVDGMRVPVAYLPESVEGFSLKQVAIARPAIAPAYYYGGNDFNQYSIQAAEENIYPAAKGSSLLTVYQQTVQPLLKEWDASARLIESRAMLNNPNPEYLQLPGSSGEALKVMPLYVYRFASSPLKQTLNVYVLEKEVRVHRMVWGETQIDISRVQIDSDQAMAIARKAVSNRESSPGYPVYPMAQDLRQPGMQVIYDLPEKLTWQIHLNQQESKQLRYQISFFHGQEGVNIGVPVPMPVPMMAADTSVVSSDGTVTNTPTIAPGEPSPSQPVPVENQSWSGSMEIDAISGKIISLNRPVLYAASGSGGGSVGYAVPGSTGVAYTEPAIALAPAQK